MSVLDVEIPEKYMPHRWAWRQGWLVYYQDPWGDGENPHAPDTAAEKHEAFDEGREMAEFQAKVDNGYFDW